MQLPLLSLDRTPRTQKCKHRARHWNRDRAGVGTRTGLEWRQVCHRQRWAHHASTSTRLPQGSQGQERALPPQGRFRLWNSAHGSGVILSG